MRSHLNRTPVEECPVDLLAWTHLTSFVSLVEARLNKWLSDAHGISLSEYRALNHLRSASDKELRINDLAQKSGLNQSSVTRMLTRLEAKALTYRDTCPDDARGVYAVISEEGDALLGQMRKGYDQQLRELLTRAGKHFPEIDPRQVSRALADTANLVRESHTQD